MVSVDDVKAEVDADFAISFLDFVEQTLTDRDPGYTAQLVEKLNQQGILNVEAFRDTPRSILEALHLSSSFKLVEVSDTIKLHNSLTGYNPLLATRRPWSPRRSRSPGKGRRKGDGRKGDGRKRNGRFRGGFLHDSRSHRGRGYDDRRPRSQEPKTKPVIWSAVASGDIELVRQLLRASVDIECRYEGWTPLMKAAEMGHVIIIEALLERSADIDARNRKGRTALSFAAAPSMDGTAKRPAALDALRLLLQRGADHTYQDVRGFTAEDHARVEKRDDALAVFSEFGFSSGR